MIRAIQQVHAKGILHRDIKPENFCIALGQEDLTKANIHIIDFGLSKRYVREGRHIPMKEGHALIGTCRYCSLNAHMGIELSRRDDLESIGHVLIYFLTGGRLPWSGLPGATTQEKYDNVKKVKFETPFKDLCKN